MLLAPLFFCLFISTSVISTIILASFFGWLFVVTTVISQLGQLSSAPERSNFVLNLEARLISNSQSVASLYGIPEEEYRSWRRSLEIEIHSPENSWWQDLFPSVEQPLRARVLDLPVAVSFWISEDRELTDSEILCMSPLLFVLAQNLSRLARSWRRLHIAWNSVGH